MMSSKQKGGKRPFAGRVGFAFNTPENTPSRKKYKCPVCGTLKQSDKLHEHVTNLCRFETNGEPVRPNSNKFKDFSQEAQTHTKYCHEKNIKKATVQSWKTAIPESADTGFEQSYFKQWKKSQSDLGESTASENREVKIPRFRFTDTGDIHVPVPVNRGTTCHLRNSRYSGVRKPIGE
jgi:hypothetical protein